MTYDPEKKEEKSIFGVIVHSFFVVPFLIAGIISGILIFIGVYLLGSNAKTGMMLVTAVSGMLTIVFLMRLWKTHAFMPSGMLLLLSAGVLIFCLSQFQNIKV